MVAFSAGVFPPEHGQYQQAAERIFRYHTEPRLRFETSLNDLLRLR
jgi:hypothetical protein